MDEDMVTIDLIEAVQLLGRLQQLSPGTALEAQLANLIAVAELPMTPDLIMLDEEQAAQLGEITGATLA